MTTGDLAGQEAEVAALLASAPAGTVAERLRRARLRQGLSVRKLASAARVDKGSVVRLEAGESVRPLTVLKVCQAMGIHVAALTKASDEGAVVRVHRAEAGEWHGLADLGGGPVTGATALTKILDSRLDGGSIMSNIVVVTEPTEGQAVAGEEFVYVLSGVLLLTVGGQEHELAPGDSACFWSSEHHTYAPGQESNGAPQFLCVTTHSRRS